MYKALNMIFNCFAIWPLPIQYLFSVLGASHKSIQALESVKNSMIINFSPPEKDCVAIKYPYPTLTGKLEDSITGYKNMMYTSTVSLEYLVK